MTAEPRMEELLASIRKAIHDDIGDVQTGLRGQSSGTLVKGSMREMHVRMGDEQASAAAEIQQLRNRIQRTRAERNDDDVFHAAEPQRQWRQIEAAPARPGYLEEDMQRFEEQVRAIPRRIAYGAPAPADEAAFSAEPPRTGRAAGLMSEEASAAVNGAFNRFAETMLSRATGDRPIEDLTRDMLRQMLRQWLDENLPAMVERLVREEIERVARRDR